MRLGDDEMCWAVLMRKALRMSEATFLVAVAVRARTAWGLMTRVR